MREEGRASSVGEVGDCSVGCYTSKPMQMQAKPTSITLYSESAADPAFPMHYYPVCRIL